MLVLTRDPEKSIIHIGDNIQVQVLQVRGNRVRLGIIAPADVAVRRDEVQAESGAKEKPKLAVDDDAGNR